MLQRSPTRCLVVGAIVALVGCRARSPGQPVSDFPLGATAINAVPHGPLREALDELSRKLLQAGVTRHPLRVRVGVMSWPPGRGADFTDQRVLGILRSAPDLGFVPVGRWEPASLSEVLSPDADAVLYGHVNADAALIASTLKLVLMDATTGRTLASVLVAWPSAPIR